MEVPNFEKAFQHFSETVYPRFGETRFESFRDGAANGWEGYKPKLRLRALKRLKSSDWDSSEINSGKILRDAIEAIEIDGNEQTRNAADAQGRVRPVDCVRYLDSGAYH